MVDHAPRTVWDDVQETLAAARLRVGVVAAAAVVLASLSLRPLLDGAWWFPRTVAVVAALALAGAAVRAVRLPAPAQPAVQAVTLLVALTVMFARAEGRWGFLPGPAALGRLRDLAAQGRAFADASVPPAGWDPGLLLLIVAGIGLVALAVDTLAAGLDLPGLTLVPLVALFLVPWAISGGSAPTWSFVAVAIGWLGLLSSTQRDRAASWSPQARPGSAGGGLAVAAATTVVAILAGGLVTLSGPGDPLRIGTGAGGGSGAVELDALVSLRRSLVSNDDRLVMTYSTTAERPDYLRLAVLEQFDGETWRPTPETELGQQPPPGSAGGGAGSGVLAEYRVDVGPLTGSVVPSPAGTINVLNTWPVAWDQRTSLPLRADGGSVEGERIGLVVSPAQWDADSLRAASLRPAPQSGVDPDNVADPEPLVGPELPQLAREITAGAGSPYDAAVALQRWFTSEGGFSYSTQVTTGSGEDALATFLDERIGYCEQFSATMALMARAVGIPARVVIGFTQGTQEAGTWAVRGSDAHAWPELWMGQAGWVRFEPTPGAPTTAAPDYTQATAEPSAQPSASAPTFGGNPADQPTDVPRNLLDADGLQTGASGGGASRSVVWPLATAILLVVLLVPSAVRLVRRRRRVRAADGEAAYRELADTLLDLGLGDELATPRATVAAARAALEESGEALDDDVRAALLDILSAVELQRYAAPGAVSPDRIGRTRSSADADPPGSGAVAVLEPAPAQAAREPADLVGSLRTARRALGRRAGVPRRIRAALAPRSVLRGISGG
jgi:transglutaminase-like putative cysteine protease